ncbi:hypothetical protein AVEN_188845-1 [Araneus ventricosus]|uniref:Uncharacterized protein n=1 Tax=Araneus ventricosus TaxID=182803 RepID=A0A4Y2BT37_ARAVE|nr:hypothetical protein AVEN_188845-1 [Araneus ventricosus]
MDSQVCFIMMSKAVSTSPSPRHNLRPIRLLRIEQFRPDFSRLPNPPYECQTTFVRSQWGDGPVCPPPSIFKQTRESPTPDADIISTGKTRGSHLVKARPRQLGTNPPTRLSFSS